MAVGLRETSSRRNARSTVSGVPLLSDGASRPASAAGSGVFWLSGFPDTAVGEAALMGRLSAALTR